MLYFNSTGSDLTGGKITTVIECSDMKKESRNTSETSVKHFIKMLKDVGMVVPKSKETRL